jgi:hypothetical protein
MHGRRRGASGVEVRGGIVGGVGKCGRSDGERTFPMTCDMVRCEANGQRSACLRLSPEFLFQQMLG